MDLISSILATKQASNASQIQYAVAGKILDQQKAQGNADLQLVQAASKLGPGDSMVAAATGLGGQLDTYA